MVLITLIGERQAQEGNEFIYNGPLPECKNCNLKSVCFNLDKGKRYKVKGLRDVEHKCRIHHEGVRVVEVEIVEIKAILPKTKAIEGSVISFEKQDCKNLGCKYYLTCNPDGIKPGDKIKVKAVKTAIRCPNKEKVVNVVLEQI